MYSWLIDVINVIFALMHVRFAVLFRLSMKEILLEVIYSYKMYLLGYVFFKL